MPNERMADNDHPVLLSEFYIAIGGSKIIIARLGMDHFPFENIFRRDRVELGFCEKRADLICSRKLGLVQRGADEESILEDFFQLCLSNGMPGRTIRKNADQEGYELSFQKE